MKRLTVLLLLVCLLPGCESASQELERGLKLRDRLLSSGCRFDVDITADYADGAAAGTFTANGKEYNYSVTGNAEEYEISLTEK